MLHVKSSLGFRPGGSSCNQDLENFMKTLDCLDQSIMPEKLCRVRLGSVHCPECLRLMALQQNVTALIADFEETCLNLEVLSARSAAERKLSEFASRSDAIDLSLAVIRNTHCPAARYHACTTLRSAGLKKWSTIPEAQRYGSSESLRMNLLNFAASSNLQAFERGAILRVVAAFARRAYVEESRESRSSFIQSVCVVAKFSNLPDVTAQTLTALEMLLALLTDFERPTIADTSSPLDQEIARRSKSTFMEDSADLEWIFNTAASALEQLFVLRDAPHVVIQNLAISISALLGKVITFGGTASDEALSETTYVTHRDMHWHTVLSRLSSIIPMLFHLHNITGPCKTSEQVLLHQNIRESLNGIASVSSRSYLTKEHSLAVLAALCNELEKHGPSFSNVKEDRLLYAEVWRRLSIAHGLESVASTRLPALESLKTQTLSLLADKVHSQRKNLADGEDDWQIESECLLLECWMNLTLQAEKLGLSNHLEPLVTGIVICFLQTCMPSQLHECTGIGSQLEISCGDDSDEDFGYDDESLEIAQRDAAAILFRFATPSCLSSVAERLNHLSEYIFTEHGNGCQMNAAEIGKLRRAQESTVCLLQLAAAILADNLTAETPEIPPQLLSRNGVRSVQLEASTQYYPVVDLFSAILTAAKLDSSNLKRCLGENQHSPTVSPRIESTLLDSLSRVAKTYLVRDWHENGAKIHVLPVELCVNARQLCLEKSIFALTQRSHEHDVARSAASLLCILAEGRASGCYPELCNDEIWAPLFHLPVERFAVLPDDVVRMIWGSFARGQGNSILPAVVEPALNLLVNLNRGKLGDASISEKTMVALNMLTGICLHAHVDTSVAHVLVNSLRRPNGALCVTGVCFARINVHVSDSVIRLADALISSRLNESADDELQEAFVASVNLVCEISSVLQKELSTTSQDELLSIAVSSLTLLRNTLEWRPIRSIREAAFTGWLTILPLIGDGVIATPEGRAAYSNVVSRLASVFPEYLVMLPTELCSRFMSDLQDLSRSYDAHLARLGLEATEAVAKHRAQVNTDIGFTSTSTVTLDGALKASLTYILGHFLLGGSSFGSSVETAIDALPPLFVCGNRSGFSEHQLRSQLCQWLQVPAQHIQALLHAFLDATSQAAINLGMQNNRGAVSGQSDTGSFQLRAVKKQFRASILNLCNQAGPAVLACGSMHSTY